MGHNPTFAFTSLDSGLMADQCNYPSEIDTDGRMFGGKHLGFPYAPPNVGANLVFAHCARFALRLC
ncbi:MAG: hypothetical protein BECKG1743D_GA0114223_1000711 [Candidatus Kentron sp. G]|nr:MAG: hypothetical protein BECKG1743F_GA0114225_1000612 [Candidatus Kentron sp. G]VFM97278.1 MAG: hypothetical protein BECKG1743D_GA0114223_1000711 [Candidatus Kentron sp. G]